MISAIVLAAGESKRMGEMKQLLPWKGKTVIEAVIDNLLSSKLDEIIVVLGYNREKITGFIKDKNVKIAFNENYKDGMFLSIKAGLSLLSDKCRSFMIVLGDQPHIKSDTIDIVIDEFLRGNKGILSPIFKGKKGHPIIFDIKYKEDIMKLNNNATLRDVIKDNRDDILMVDVEDEGVTKDLDKREDYLECL
jgi:molybdenum cofactor cytidylyltransferase